MSSPEATDSSNKKTSAVENRIPGPVSLVIRLTWLDFIRRKDLLVVALFMLLFVAATGVIRLVSSERGMDITSARFLMSAGLTLSHLLAAFLAASFCGRTFPEEFERGTLMPLLAKPVTRGQVLTGKLVGSLQLVLGSYLLFVLLTLLAVPLVEGQRWSALGQVVILHLVSLTMLGIAAMALSLYLPTLVSALLALAWYFGAGFALNLFGGGSSAVMNRLVACIPDATLLNHIECFAGPAARLEGGLFGGLLLYGLAWSALLYLWAGWRFERIRL